MHAAVTRPWAHVMKQNRHSSACRCGNGLEDFLYLPEMHRMVVTEFNPNHDPSGVYANQLVDTLAEAICGVSQQNHIQIFSMAFLTLKVTDEV